METPGRPPKEFAEVEKRLTFLQALRDQGKLTPEAYQAEVQRLTVKDASGRTWWLGGEAGAWHWWDGQAWVRGQPPMTPAPTEKPASPSQPQAQKPRGRIGLFAGLGCIGLVIVCLVASGIFLGGGYAEYQALPKIVEDIQVDVAAAAPLPLSSDQQQVRSEMGDPEAFMILFYEEPLDNGSIGDVRTETWSYYTQGVEYTFINGEMVGEDPIEVDISDLAPVPYQPEQFAAYMNLEEVIAAAGLDSFLVVPLEKELVDGGEVYYADRLTFGLKNDELRYVEALALEVEG
jgi:hypothetical protein